MTLPLPVQYFMSITGSAFNSSRLEITDSPQQLTITLFWTTGGYISAKQTTN